MQLRSPAPHSRRHHSRVAVRRAAVLHLSGRQVPVVLQDVSQGGVRLALPAQRRDLPLEGAMRLDIPGLGLVSVQLRWRDGAQAGLAFDAPPARLSSLVPQLGRMFGLLRR